MKYYIREAAEIKVAQEEEIKRLCLENSTPFDDRAASNNGKKTYSNQITLAVEYQIVNPRLRDLETKCRN